MTVRTRIAPSPTGYAHVGLISRILINYALAQKHGGQFIWRNEDTDTERSKQEYLDFNLKWTREFGLNWDEGPDIGGPYAPYSQTQRLEIYKVAADKLIEKGYAYRCFCTKERLDELRSAQELMKQRTHYDGLCRNLSDDEINQNLAEGKSYTVRIKMPRDKKIEFDDIITHNHIIWDSNEVDDYIIMKSNGIPTYHLAAMVDDVEMKITHVFRGSEWIATTPVHMMIYEGLGHTKETMPKIGHFTVILDPATPGKKFSKRNNSFKANNLVIRGYLKPAILNYLMLLGWAPKDNRELFTLEEFVQAFDLDGMQKSNPTWDHKKMDWFGGIYMRQLSKEDFSREFLSWIDMYLTKESREDIVYALTQGVLSEEKMDSNIDFAKTLSHENFELLTNRLALVQERATNFWDALQQVSFFYKKPENIDWDIKQLKNVQDKLDLIKKDLNSLHSSLADDPKSWVHEEWEQGIRAIGDKHGAKHGDIFMVLRVSVVGEPYSPPMFESLQLMVKEEILPRL
jgi:glutamyl-tRNA synthetase